MCSEVLSSLWLKYHHHDRTYSIHRSCLEEERVNRNSFPHEDVSLLCSLKLRRVLSRSCTIPWLVHLVSQSSHLHQFPELFCGQEPIIVFVKSTETKCLKIEFQGQMGPHSSDLTVHLNASIRVSRLISSCWCFPIIWRNSLNSIVSYNLSSLTLLTILSNVFSEISHHKQPCFRYIFHNAWVSEPQSPYGSAALWKGENPILDSKTLKVCSLLIF